MGARSMCGKRRRVSPHRRRQGPTSAAEIPESQDRRPPESSGPIRAALGVHLGWDKAAPGPKCPWLRAQAWPLTAQKEADTAPPRVLRWEEFAQLRTSDYHHRPKKRPGTPSNPVRPKRLFGIQKTPWVGGPRPPWSAACVAGTESDPPASSRGPCRTPCCGGL